MRDYGAVSPNFWTGHTGKLLRRHREAQLLAIYLMTSPHSNMIGVYRCPHMYCIEETGLTAAEVELAYQVLQDLDFCRYDHGTDEVFVVTMARWQIAESLKPADKRCKGISRELSRVLSDVLRQAFFAEYAQAFNLDGGISSPTQGGAKALRSQEQEQEHGHGQNQDKSTARDGMAAPPGDVDAGVWADFVRQRRAGLSNTAVQELRTAAAAANMPFEQALRLAIKRGWRGFEASWLVDATAPSSGQKNSSNRISETVPSAPGKDPALVKMDADSARAAPPPAGFFAQLRASVLGGQKQ